MEHLQKVEKREREAPFGWDWLVEKKEYIAFGGGYGKVPWLSNWYIINFTTDGEIPDYTNGKKHNNLFQPRLVQALVNYRVLVWCSL